MQTLDFIYQHKLVAISRGVYGQDLLEAARRVSAGGIKLLEITFDQKDAAAQKLTAQGIALIKDSLGDQMCVGAGTVMTKAQVQAAAASGADFALAPDTNPEVIAEMKRLNLIAVPGAFTPSEIAAAYRAGADIVKLFPASVLGIDYVKAIRGPINHIPLMAVGGVSTSNVKAFLDNSFCSAGIGSHIISAAKLAAGDFAGVEAAARAFVQAIAA